MNCKTCKIGSEMKRILFRIDVPKFGILAGEVHNLNVTTQRIIDSLKSGNYFLGNTQEVKTQKEKFLSKSKVKSTGGK